MNFFGPNQMISYKNEEKVYKNIMMSIKSFQEHKLPKLSLTLSLSLSLSLSLTHTHTHTRSAFTVDYSGLVL